MADQRLGRTRNRNEYEGLFSRVASTLYANAADIFTDTFAYARQQMRTLRNPQPARILAPPESRTGDGIRYGEPVTTNVFHEEEKEVIEQRPVSAPVVEAPPEERPRPAKRRKIQMFFGVRYKGLAIRELTEEQLREAAVSYGVDMGGTVEQLRARVEAKISSSVPRHNRKVREESPKPVAPIVQAPSVHNHRIVEEEEKSFAVLPSVPRAPMTLRDMMAKGHVPIFTETLKSMSGVEDDEVEEKEEEPVSRCIVCDGTTDHSKCKCWVCSNSIQESTHSTCVCPACDISMSTTTADHSNCKCRICKAGYRDPRHDHSSCNEAPQVPYTPAAATDTGATSPLRAPANLPPSSILSAMAAASTNVPKDPAPAFTPYTPAPTTSNSSASPSLSFGMPKTTTSAPPTQEQQEREESQSRKRRPESDIHSSPKRFGGFPTSTPPATSAVSDDEEECPDCGMGDGVDHSSCNVSGAPSSTPPAPKPSSGAPVSPFLSNLPKLPLSAAAASDSAAPATSKIPAFNFGGASSTSGSGFGTGSASTPSPFTLAKPSSDGDDAKDKSTPFSFKAPVATTETPAQEASSDASSAPSIPKFSFSSTPAASEAPAAEPSKPMFSFAPTASSSSEAPAATSTSGFPGLSATKATAPSTTGTDFLGSTTTSDATEAAPKPSFGFSSTSSSTSDKPFTLPGVNLSGSTDQQKDKPAAASSSFLNAPGAAVSFFKTGSSKTPATNAFAPAAKPAAEQPAPSTAFSSQPAAPAASNPFATPATSTPSIFGQPDTSTSGAPVAADSGNSNPFGSSAVKSNPFGRPSSNTAAPSFGAGSAAPSTPFAANGGASTSGFMPTTPAPSTGGFGGSSGVPTFGQQPSTPAPPAFGQASAGTTGFGQPRNAPDTPFGQPPNTFAAPSTGFNTTQQQAPSSFSQAVAASSSVPSFNMGGGGFTQAPSGGNMFSQPPAQSFTGGPAAASGGINFQQFAPPQGGSFNPSGLSAGQPGANLNMGIEPRKIKKGKRRGR